MSDEEKPEAYARRTDPSTSHIAARSLDDELPRLELVVLKAVRKTARGATSHELEKSTGLSLVTISPRLRPLQRKGLIVDSGERRKGASGRPSIVWKAMPAQGVLL